METDSATGLAAARATVMVMETGLDAGSAMGSGLVSAMETGLDAGSVTDLAAARATVSDAGSVMASDAAKASAMDAEPESGSALIEKVCLPCRAPVMEQLSAYFRAYRHFRNYARLLYAR